MELNDFVDFDAMFTELFREQEKTLEEYKYEADRYMIFLSFIDEKEQFSIQPPECVLTDEYIDFVYGFSHNDANESNNESGWTTMFIRYDRILDEFTICEYDGG